MKGSCLHCGEREVEEFASADLEFKGVLLKVPNEERVMCEECFKKRLLKMFKRYGHVIEIVNKNSMKVDWKIFCQEAEWHETQVVETLLALDLISLNSAGCWEIMSDQGMILNPKLCMENVFFKSFDDAAKFAMEKYSDSLFSWYLRQIMSVHSRKDLVDMGYEKINGGANADENA